MEQTVIDLGHTKRRPIVLWTPWGPVPVEKKPVRIDHRRRGVDPEREITHRRHGEPAMTH
ncbi:MAG: hypothetical protein JJ864_07255 [Rhizobiaceae bacterium]|nr:hypothetical protein [Maricaulis sp.]MBO6901128.1 hypothetical protein [Rhizobiaceae bacterium]